MVEMTKKIGERARIMGRGDREMDGRDRGREVILRWQGDGEITLRR